MNWWIIVILVVLNFPAYRYLGRLFLWGKFEERQSEEEREIKSYEYISMKTQKGLGDKYEMNFFAFIFIVITLILAQYWIITTIIELL